MLDQSNSNCFRHHDIYSYRADEACAANVGDAGSKRKRSGRETIVDTLRQDIRQTKDSIAGFVHDPLSGAAEMLLVPAALSLLKGLRSKKG